MKKNNFSFNQRINLSVINVISSETLHSKIYTPRGENKKGNVSIFFDPKSGDGYEFSYAQYSKIKNGADINEVLSPKKIEKIVEYTGIDQDIITGELLLIEDEEIIRDFEKIEQIQKVRKKIHILSSSIEETQRDELKLGKDIDKIRIEPIDIIEVEDIVEIIDDLKKIEDNCKEFYDFKNVYGIEKQEKTEFKTYINAMVFLTLWDMELERIKGQLEKRIATEVLKIWDNIFHAQGNNVAWSEIKNFILKKLKINSKLEFLINLLSSVTDDELKEISQKKLIEYKRTLHLFKKKIDKCLKEE